MLASDSPLEWADVESTERPFPLVHIAPPPPRDSVNGRLLWHVPTTTTTSYIPVTRATSTQSGTARQRFNQQKDPPAHHPSSISVSPALSDLRPPLLPSTNPCRRYSYSLCTAGQSCPAGYDSTPSVRYLTGRLHFYRQSHITRNLVESFIPCSARLSIPRALPTPFDSSLPAHHIHSSYRQSDSPFLLYRPAFSLPLLS